MTMDKPPPHMDGKFVAVIACCFSVLWGEGDIVRSCCAQQDGAWGCIDSNASPISINTIIKHKLSNSIINQT